MGFFWGNRWGGGLFTTKVADEENEVIKATPVCYTVNEVAAKRD
jgi:hypothetical protein